MTDYDMQMMKQLDYYRVEHRQLDTTIDEMLKSRPDAELEIVRLKKKKLNLRDEISRLESMIYPDIIA